MKSKLFKISGAFILAFMLASPLFAEDAIVTFVQGKVEVNRKNTWVALKAGDAVYESETISTGFGSEAKIKYKGSLMSLSALTRITLKELSSTAKKDNVDVYLNTGAVRSKVTHTTDTRVSYKVTGPVATASVRGTVVDSFADGYNECLEGGVAVYPTVLKTESKVTDDAEVVVDYDSANANTPAVEIDDNAPKGTIVIGAGQMTQFDENGNVQDPQFMNTVLMNGGTSGVTTAAEEDALINWGTVISGSDAVISRNGGALFHFNFN